MLHAVTEARYDEVADWYDDWIGEEAAEGSLAATTADTIGEVAGLRVLDLACGNGVIARRLAARGGVVHGVDLAARLIEKARSVEARSPRGITYHVGSATNTAWWDGEPFDAVVCNMGLSDIDDLDGAMASVFRVLRPGRPAAFSVMHPCFPGHEEGLSSWPPQAGYFAEGWWTTGGEGCRGRVGAHHRMLSTYVNSAITNGLMITRMLEPPFPRDDPPRLPSLLVLVCQRSS